MVDLHLCNYYTFILELFTGYWNIWWTLAAAGMAGVITGFFVFSF